MSDKPGINDQLQQYLSKSGTSTSSSSSGAGGVTSAATNILGSVKGALPALDKLSWFSSDKSGSNMFPEQQEPLVSNSNNGEGNGWFTTANKDPWLPTLSKKQRVVGFMLCLFMGFLCFGLAMMYIPMLVFYARKFSLLYTLGSLFIISSFALLWGPWNHMKHICSADRLPFTLTYFGSMFATVYFAISWESTVLTVIFAVIQIGALLWYIISYIPGGQTGLKFFTKIFSTVVGRTAKKTLPI